MRYAPLKSVKSSWIRPVTRSRTVLLTLIVKDLYEKFHERQIDMKSPSRQIGSSAVKSACDTKTSAIASNLVHQKGAKTSFFIMPKTSAQRLSFQQQRQVTPSFFASPRAIVYGYRRHHSRRPEACCWWRRRPRWIWPHGEDCAKTIWYWIKV